MEYEVRYYYPKSKYNEIINKLKNIKSLEYLDKFYEKTIQYDHPSSDNSFYRKEVDGRFRIRISKSDKEKACKISWKRRLKTIRLSHVNEEEEKEVSIDYNDYDNLLFIVTNVLKMKKIESYERYRTIFFNDDIEIAIDEYPFGIALEIENKSNTIDAKENVKKWVNLLGLSIEDSYRLSWDDKYTELCKSQNIKIYEDVTFDLPMPEVRD